MPVKKSNSTFVVILTSYVVIIVVFTIMMAGLFLYSANTITKQIRQTDGYIAERTVQQASDMLENLYDQGEMLVQDDRLTLFSNLDPVVQKITGAKTSQIMERANNFTELTADLFFCPEGPDMIMNKTGIHEGEDLINMLQETMGISMEEWKERTSFPGKRAFQIVAVTDEQGVRHRYFLMMVRKPGEEDNGRGCFVAGIVPIDFFNNLSNNIRPEGYEDIIVEYPNGIFSYSRNSLITQEELAEAQRSSTEIFPMIFSGQSVHVTTSEGKIDDFTWRIHFFCSMAPYRNVVVVCLISFAVTVLIVLIIGSIVLWLTISHQYRPLKILMDRISGRRGEGSPALRREYRVIDQAIGALQEKQQGTENRLVEYRTRLQETAVDQLLRGKDIREKSLVKFFQSNELNLRFEKCRVLLLALDTDEKMEGLEENDADDLRERLLKDMGSFMYQCLPNSCCIVTDDCVECLICSDNEERDAEIQQFMKDNLVDYCRENNMHFYAAISKADKGTEGAHRAFTEAESILDYVTMTGYRDVIMEELPEQRHPQAKSRQEIKQQQLIEYVDEHFTDASLSVLQMADIFDMSPSSVSRMFKQAAKTGLNEYINTLRVERAKELINTTGDSLKRISELVGYGNQITMIRAFKKLEGVTPREYRDQIQNRTETDSGPD